MIGTFVEGGGEEGGMEGWQVEVEDEVVDRMKLPSGAFPGKAQKKKRFTSFDSANGRCIGDNDWG